jgi:hypothetical protein
MTPSRIRSKKSFMAILINEIVLIDFIVEAIAKISEFPKAISINKNGIIISSDMLNGMIVLRLIGILSSFLDKKHEITKAKDAKKIGVVLEKSKLAENPYKSIKILINIEQNM